MKNSNGKPISLSPSSLSLMEECPRCFWLQVMNGVRRPEGIFPSLPSGMDNAIKTHFDIFREKGQLPPELKGKIDAELFSDIDKLNVWRNNWKGITYTDTEGIILKGIVDELLIRKGKLIVLDFKTRGFPPKEDTHLYYQNQLDIYSYLFEMNKEKIENFAYLLFYHPNCFNPDGSFKFHTDIVKVETNSKNAQNIFDKAKELLMGKKPEPNPECPYCNILDGFK